ncbi:hypothetical protein ESA94_02215 [Lacibacter luteus]|uniref:Glycosyltransferase RgtA/B/C/D-like domain-containing protein n=1 Tax=Lacibacter luteus TaxID=2508719 RepID=A0A4V1M7X3_9BACT|nr:hypothetical protein [Lacibacter luteus]RXK61852.1 hypothetical protein ESA94_02215 [Lacibacter luteus]
MSWLKKLFVPVIILLCTLISINANKHPEKLIWSDMEGYYVYLPAVFIYDGFKKEAVRDTAYIKEYPGTNIIYSKYTAGVAILELPFFLTAHFLSKPLGYIPDGHSLIYAYALMAAGIFYLLAGLFLLWKVAVQYYNRLAVALALFFLLAGTNLYYYSFFQPAMSHVFSFFLFACLLFQTEKLAVSLKNNKPFPISFWLLLAITSGLIILTRPTNIIVLLYPFLRWLKECSDKTAFLKTNMKGMLPAALAFILPFIPQLIYWHHVSGKSIIWSYNNESFIYWKEPKLIRVLIDPWNGWLLYSPVVIFPLIWMLATRKKSKHAESVILLIFVIATYLFASWWAWWFGGAFGHRSYVEFYALLALPFASFISWLQKSKWKLSLFLFTVMIFAYYNLGLTYNYSPPWDGPNWTYESVWLEIRKLFFFL